MSLLLRMVLIGLTPLFLAGLGIFFSASWGVLLGLTLIGIGLTVWMYQHGIIRHMHLSDQAGENLQHQQSLLQAAVDNAPLMIGIKDADGRYQMINREYERQFGFSRQQIIGNRDVDVHPAETARIFRTSDLKVLESGEKMTYRAMVQSQGQWRQLETTKFPLRGADQQIVGVGLVSTDITELAASQEKFARVFHASPDWIVITRLSDSVVVEANEGFERISGHNFREAVGQPLGSFDIWVHPEQRAAIIEKLLRDGAVSDTLVQLRRRDGSVLDCIANATLIALEGEQNSHAVWIARDVTREHAVQAQFVAAFRLTPEFMSITRVSDGRYVEVNEAFERFTGYTRDEVVGRTSLELGLWNKASQRQAVLDIFKTHDVVREFPVEMRKRDGQVRVTLLNAALYKTHGERFMLVVLRDITDALQTERNLRESEARFASLFEQSPIPTSYTVDTDNYTSNHRNDAFYKTFGYSRDAQHGTLPPKQGIWAHAEDAERAQQIRLNEEAVSNWVVEVVCGDGSRRWVSLYACFIVEPHRKIVVSTLIDITDQLRARQEILDLNAQLEDRVSERTRQLQDANTELSKTFHTLSQAKDQLVQSEKLAALGALVAGVAHELNTPIGNGLTVASSLEFKTTEFTKSMAGGLTRSTLDKYVADARSASSIMVSNLTRAADLVRSFKQVAVDQTSSKRREFELQEVVSEIVLTLSPSIRHSGCTVVTDISADLRFDSYPGPLGQVLSNLINNAIIHGYGDGQGGTITMQARAAGIDEVELAVIDQGRGIESANLKRIFEPFYTTRLGQGGSGLGLHIVHNIVTGVLGGTIDVRSNPGQGAVFTLRLPVNAPALDSVAGDL